MLPPEMDEFISAMFSYLISLDHSHCTPPENTDSNKIIVFVNGQHGAKHHHLPADIDLDVEDLVGIDDNTIYRIIGIALTHLPQGDNILCVYIAAQIASAQMVQTLLGRIEDLTSRDEILQQIMDMLTGNDDEIPSDAMNFFAPDPDSEAEKEMLEWDRILHPERYKN